MLQHKLHILAIAVHPDDIELGCAGTLIKHVLMGDKVGIIDLTRGELGTRGTATTRLKEARDAAKAMGISVRENAGMADGFFVNDEQHQRILINYIRHYAPDVVITNALADRHPDHGRAGKLVADACFYAGLRKIETEWNGTSQLPWRPRRVYHMLQDRHSDPQFIIDISDVFDKKMAAIKCYTSQFHNPESDEPMTYIAGEAFLKHIEARDMIFGKRIGARYGEGFHCENIPGLNSLNDIILPELP